MNNLPLGLNQFYQDRRIHSLLDEVAKVSLPDFICIQVASFCLFSSVNGSYRKKCGADDNKMSEESFLIFLSFFPNYSIFSPVHLDIDFK